MMSMGKITYSQVQTLISQLPEAKLPIAYRLLLVLIESEAEPLSPQLAFTLLPLTEREAVLRQQAEQMVAYYEQTAAEREE